jgi:hypothetical protein
MKTSKENMQEIERLFDLYQDEVDSLTKRRIIMENTSKTYLLHSYNFVRWCKGEFTPGAKKMG